MTIVHRRLQPARRRWVLVVLVLVLTTTTTTTTVLLSHPSSCCSVYALATPKSPTKTATPATAPEEPGSRRNFFQQALLTSSAFAVAGVGVGTGTSAAARAAAAADNPNAKLELSDDQLKKVVLSDILEKQFLVTGNLTPSIYSPEATFTDEIDTYQMDAWMVGTSRLFVGEKSKVRLVGDVDVHPEKIEFRFDEDLMFRIPLLYPVVSLTGKVVMERDSASGLIKSYREFWDQDVATVLKSAKIGGK